MRCLPRLAVLVLASALVAGCGTTGSADRQDGAAAEVAAPTAPADFGHVHGLGVVSGDLIVATHMGLFRSPRGTTSAERVGASRRDVMGFTGVGDRVFGSGHPDPENPGDEPGNVGVITSSDAGRTWTPVALAGEVDFHAFGGSERALYGYDGASGRLLASGDEGRSFEERPEAPKDVFSIAVDPADPRALLVATPDGVLRSSDGGRSFASADVPAGILAWGAVGAFAVGADGAVQRSTDGGRTWKAAGSIGSLPVAAYATADALYVAQEDGTVLVSTDRGEQFTTRARLG